MKKIIIGTIKKTDNGKWQVSFPHGIETYRTKKRAVECSGIAKSMWQIGLDENNIKKEYLDRYAL